MDIDVLANQTVPYISAAVGAYGGAVLTKLEQNAADETVRVGQRLLRTLLHGGTGRPAVQHAVLDLASAQSDPDFQAALRAQVKLVLREDGQLAAQLAALLPLQQTVSAEGDRSVAVGGGNTGLISTGDHATNIQNPTTHVTGKRAEVYIGSRVTKRRILLLPFGFVYRVTRNAGSAATSHPVAAVMAGTALVAGAVSGGLLLSRTSAGDPLSGDWRDGSGNIVQFTSSGAHSWTGEVTHGNTDVCLPLHIAVTGDGSHYQGTEAYYTGVWGDCGSFKADGSIALAVEAGGTKLDVTTAGPGAQLCSNCAPTVWTKQ
jgi:hypothetical protein